MAVVNAHTSSSLAFAVLSRLAIHAQETPRWLRQSAPVPVLNDPASLLRGEDKNTHSLPAVDPAGQEDTGANYLGEITYLSIFAVPCRSARAGRNGRVVDGGSLENC